MYDSCVPQSIPVDQPYCRSYSIPPPRTVPADAVDQVVPSWMVQGRVGAEVSVRASLR